ncbi:MAG: sel1 repeat family protein, partial [Sulfurovaceae bacterium]|nr:sel1 repeat family protein [Sulfurovaceae bacterium]
MKKSMIISMLFLLNITLNATPLEKHTKLCKAGESTSCRSIGFMYKMGKSGATQDYKKAVEFYNKACDMGDSV